MVSCPCGTGQEYNSCCEPFIQGQDEPQTAEKLMRSRYTAFAKGLMDYIANTHDPKTRDQVDFTANQAWSDSSEWLGLEIKKVEKGGIEDDRGQIEFIANYKTDGENKSHHELSEFRKVKGKWFFMDGKNPEIQTYQREGAKIGRNDPCPCDSGKKYKKCCYLKT